MPTLKEYIEAYKQAQMPDSLTNQRGREPNADQWNDYLNEVSAGFEPIKEEKPYEREGIISELIRSAAGVASGFEAPAGSMLKGIGAELKGIGDNENGGLYKLLGDLSDSAGSWLEDSAHNEERARALTSDFWNQKKITEILSDPELRWQYITDPQGLQTDLTYGLGNAAFFALLASRMPSAFAGSVASKGLDPLSKLLGDVAINKGSAIAGKASTALGSNTAKELVGNAIQFGTTMGPAGALANAGTIVDTLREQGKSDKEIMGTINDMMIEELPADVAFAMLTGNVAKGGIGKAVAPRNSSSFQKALANAAGVPLEGTGGYYSNVYQMILADKYGGQPYGTLLDPLPNEDAAGRMGIMGAIPFAAYGGVQGYRNSKAAEAAENQRREQASQANKQIQDLYGNYRRYVDTANESAARQAYRNASKANGIDNFVNAITQQESGGDYDVVNSRTGATGRYQILPTTWDLWLEEQGLPADTPMTPENQDRVARAKMQALYNEFGNWRDVAIAWYAGEGEVRKPHLNRDAPQGNGDEPSINEYANSVMSRFQNFGGEESSSRQNSGENIFGVENYDMPTQSSSIDSQVSQLKSGWGQIIPQIGGVLKNKFNVNAEISSAARSAEHNAAVGGVPTSHHIIREEGGDALDIVFDRETTQEEQDRIADYFRNTGLFSEVLYHDVGSGAHLHLGGLRTENFGSIQARADQNFSNTSPQIPSWDEYYKSHTRQRQKDTSPDESASETPKPLFDLNDESSTTQKLFEQFATERHSQTADNYEQSPDTYNFFDGLFDTNGNFQNTEETRNAIRERYGDDFIAWATALRQQEEPVKPEQQKQSGTTAQPNQGRAGKFLNNSPLKQAIKQLKEKASKDGNMRLFTEINNAENNNDTAKLEEIAKREGISITPPQQPQQQDSVKENKPPENVLSKTDQNRLNLAQKPVNDTKAKVKQSNAILELIKKNNIPIPPKDIDLLKKGNREKRQEWQDKLRQAGVFDATPAQETTAPSEPQAPAVNPVLQAREKVNQMGGNVTPPQQSPPADTPPPTTPAPPQLPQTSAPATDTTQATPSETAQPAPPQPPPVTSPPQPVQPPKSPYFTASRDPRSYNITDPFIATYQGNSTYHYDINKIAKNHGGRYDGSDPNIFHFKEENERNAFITKADNFITSQKNQSSPKPSQQQSPPQQQTPPQAPPKPAANPFVEYARGKAQENFQKENSPKTYGTKPSIPPKMEDDIKTAMAPIPDDSAERRKQGLAMARLLRQPQFKNANPSASLINMLPRGGLKAIQQGQELLRQHPLIRQTNGKSESQPEQTPPPQSPAQQGTSQQSPPVESQQIETQPPLTPKPSQAELEREADSANEDTDNEPSAFDYLPKPDSLNDVESEETPPPKKNEEQPAFAPAEEEQPDTGKKLKPFKGQRKGRKKTATDRLYENFKADTHPYLKAYIDDLIQKARSEKDSPERHEALETLKQWQKLTDLSDESLDRWEAALRQEHEARENARRKQELQQEENEDIENQKSRQEQQWFEEEEDENTEWVQQNRARQENERQNTQRKQEREADLTNEETDDEPSAFDYLPKTADLNDVDLNEEPNPPKSKPPAAKPAKQENDNPPEEKAPPEFTPAEEEQPDTGNTNTAQLQERIAKIEARIKAINQEIRSIDEENRYEKAHNIDKDEIKTILNISKVYKGDLREEKGRLNQELTTLKAELKQRQKKEPQKPPKKTEEQQPAPQEPVKAEPEPQPEPQHKKPPESKSKTPPAPPAKPDTSPKKTPDRGGTWQPYKSFATEGEVLDEIYGLFEGHEEIYIAKNGYFYDKDSRKPITSNYRYENLDTDNSGTMKFPHVLEKFSVRERNFTSEEEKQKKAAEKKAKDDQKIIEAAKNPDVATALKNLGIEIEDGKVIAPDNATYKAAQAVTEITKAYHGSRFNFDNFSLSQIGTGEGHQAHGWGLYFAENQRAANENYKVKLTEIEYSLHGKPVSEDYKKSIEPLTDVLKDLVTEPKKGDIVKNAIKQLKQNKKEGIYSSKAEEDAVDSIIDLLKKKALTFTMSDSKLYKVELPAVGLMLDEDKPFAEQNPLVQKALKEIAEERGITFSNNMKGGGIYTAIAKSFDKNSNPFSDKNTNAEPTSKLLNEHGIVGNTYKSINDQGRCYVIFDEKNIKITGKFNVDGEGDTTVHDVIETKDLTPQQKKWVECGKRLGVNTQFFRNDNSKFHGVHKHNVTFLNANSNKSLGETFWHESLHWLANNNPQLYRALVKAAGITTEQREGYLERTGRKDVRTPDEINEEIIADSMENVADRTGLLQSIAGKERGLIQRVVQWLKDTMNKFIEMFRNPQGKLTTKQAKALSDEFGRIAAHLKDPNGQTIFRYNRRTGNIELAGGRDLSEAAIEEMTRKGAGFKEKLSITSSGDNSTQSLRQRIGNKVSSWFDGGERSKHRNHTIAKNLSKIMGLRIAFNTVSEAEGTIIDDFNKIIREPHAYQWETFLPKIGGKIAESLKLNPTEEMGNYIADWLLTGALNNTSAEARDFEKAMRDNPAQAELMLEIRNSFEELSNMTGLKRIKDNLVSMTEKKPLPERAKGVYHDAREQFIDDLAPVERAIDEMAKKLPADVAETLKKSFDPYKAFRNLRGLGAIPDMMISTEAKDIEKLRTFLREKYPNLPFDDFKSLNMIIEEAGGDTEGLNAYAAAMLEKEIYEKQRATNPDGTPKYKELQEYTHLYTEAQADSAIKEGAAKFGQAQQDLVTFGNTLLAMRYDAGLMTQKNFFKTLNSYDNYIPMAHVFEEDEEYTFSDSLKHKTGSKRDTWLPTEKLAANAHQFIRQAEQNRVKLQLANLVRCGGVGEIFAITEKSNPNLETTITFYEDGKKYYLETPDKSIVRAINTMYQKSDGAWLMKMIRAASGFLRGMYTYLSLNFSIGNLFRDLPDAYIHNRHLNTNPFIASTEMWRAGFKSVWNRDQDFFDWRGYGGSQSAFVSEDVDYIERSVLGMRKGGHYFSRALDGLQKLAEYSEYITRVNTYKSAKANLAAEHGGNATVTDKQLAALASRDASIDFSKSGISTRKINRYLFFVNATVQGLDNWGRTAQRAWNGDKAARKELWGKVFRTMVAGVLAQVLQTAFNNWDDDNREKYRQAHRWEKNANWIFGDYIKIPKAMDAGIRLLSAITDEALNHAINKDPVEWRRIRDAVIDAAPSITATIATPAFEVAANYSLYRSSPIVPGKEQHLPPEQQYGKDTSLIAQKVGELLGTSPRKIDHLISGYLGSMFGDISHFPDYAFTSKPFSWSNMPIIRRFIFDPYKNPKVVKDYYEAFEEQDTLWRGYEAKRKKGEKADLPEEYDRALHARLKAMQKPMRALSAQEQRIINDPKLSSSQIKEKLRVLEERRMALCRKALQQAR